MRRALIDPAGITHNIIEIAIEAAYPLEPGWRLGDPEANPLPSDPIPVPELVSARQLKIALLHAGLLDQIDQFAAAQPREIQISWEYATEFHRDNAMLRQMAALFGMTEDQIDGLFLSAAAIS